MASWPAGCPWLAGRLAQAGTQGGDQPLEGGYHGGRHGLAVEDGQQLPVPLHPGVGERLELPEDSRPLADGGGGRHNAAEHRLARGRSRVDSRRDGLACVLDDLLIARLGLPWRLALAWRSALAWCLGLTWRLVSRWWRGGVLPGQGHRPGPLPEALVGD